MTVKKLKKIKDPETLLHKAVLMNNILECMRNYQNIDIQRNIDADTHSNYSQDEEEILRRIRLPHPRTPISDHSFNEEEEVTEKTKDIAMIWKDYQVTLWKVTQRETVLNMKALGMIKMLMS